MPYSILKTKNMNFVPGKFCPVPGGMGSLNDVYFEPRTIEREYGKLLGRLYGFAHAIEKTRTRK